MILKRTALLIFTATLLGLILPLLAQNNETIITIAIQEWQNDVFNDDLFAEFTAQHPGVKVVRVTLPQDSYWGLNTSDFADTLERAGKFYAAADVLPLSTYQVSPEITRAGFLLDMTPLLTTDTSADLDDFYPAALQSFQWEGGTWALPAVARLEMLIYDRAAFDTAGLAYPDESWTLDDYINAGRNLTIRDDAGEVTLPGFFGFDERIFYRALLGHGLYDPMAFPEVPKLDDPELAALMESWQAYNDELMGDAEDMSALYQRLDYDAIPLRISGMWYLSDQVGPRGNRDFEGALLPGGSAFVQAEGFGISAGTQHPELAYELIQFLTRDPEVINRLFGDAPARRSMADATTDSTIFSGNQYSPEVEALIEQGLENGIPASELRYFDYIYYARSQEDMPDTLSALQAGQEQALDILAQAEAHKGSAVMSVPTPIPTPILSANEIALNFNVSGYISPLPNREQWDAAMQQFIADDPEVGYINLQTGYLSTQQLFEDMDCYVMPSNLVPAADLNMLLPLDPLIASDPGFDESDYLPGVLSQVQRDGQTWALPMTIMPSVIYYNTQMVEDAGAFEPLPGWTVTDFADTLSLLKAMDADKAPYTPMSFGNRYLIMLAAGYGGRIVDYNGDSVSYNLTDPATIEALRQVVGLVNDELIEYSALDTNSGGGFGGGELPMYDSFLSSDMRFMAMPMSADGESPYRAVTFPRGSEYAPISYDLGVAVISAASQNPEACYRWLSVISNMPELFSSMPARQSLLDAPALEASHGADTIASYNVIADYLADPALLVFPGLSGGSAFESYIMETWMNRAFDRIILEDADLETELGAAQQFIDDYEVCIADIPRDVAWMSMGEEELQAHFKLYTDCAGAVDPSMAERWNTGE